MKSILIPVDFSENTINTCRYALQFTGREKTRFLLFHIYPNQLMVADSSFPTGIDTDTFINTEYINELRDVAQENMKGLVNDFKKIVEDKGVNNATVEDMVVGGDPEYEIQQICEEIEPGMIIMGTRGAGKKGFLEGSTAEKIMNATSIPVIAVPQTYKKIRLENIMYALNFNESAYNCIEKVLNLFSHFEKELFVIHIEINERNKEEMNFMTELEEKLKSKYPGEKINFHVLNGTDKAVALNNLTEVFKIDLITFIAHKSNFFENLFSRELHKKDFFKLEIPLMALHV